MSITALGGVSAAETPYFRIAEAFTPGHGQELEVSYRVYTAPILSEILTNGALVERLEISPAELLDFENFEIYGDEIRAAQSRQAKIWLASSLPSLSGVYARQSILVRVDP